MCYRRKEKSIKYIAVLMTLIIALLASIPVMAKSTRKPYLQKCVTVTMGRQQHVPFYWANNKKAVYSIADHSVAEIEPNNSGVYVKAKNPGTTVLKIKYKGAIYSSKVVVKSIPFQQEKLGLTVVGTNPKLDEKNTLLSWNNVPGADGFQIRRTEADGSKKYVTYGLKELTEKDDLKVKKTIKGYTFYEYAGDLAQYPANKTKHDYEIAVRAYKIVDNQKIYTNWEWNGCNINFK